MFVRRSPDLDSIFVLGGSKLLEWTVTQEELEELRDAIDLVLPRVTSVTYNQNADPSSVAWRKATRTDPEHTS